jgi:hypothetical protein
LAPIQAQPAKLAPGREMQLKNFNVSSQERQVIDVARGSGLVA